MENVTEWRNKIVGYGEVSPIEAVANDKNWRTHPKYQQDALLGVLREVGLVQNVIINKRTGESWPEGSRNVETVIDGHLRVSLAIREKQPTVPVTYVDLSENEENLILSSLDPLSALAETDNVKLDALLREVETESPELQSLMADLASKAGLYKEDPKPPEDFATKDENIETEHTCPKCGYSWSGGDAVAQAE